MISTYLQGLSLGLAFAVPIGMQNLFVINSAMSRKLGRAMATSLIVTFWDISLGLACFLGAGALMAALPWLQKLILGAGGLLVIYMGIGLLRAKAEPNGEADAGQSLWKTVVSAFVVTWLNPQALIDGTLVLGAFRASLPTGSEGYFIIGVASASFLWFNALALLVHALGSRLDRRVLSWPSRICGAVIVLYGIRLLYHFAQLLWA